MNARKIIIKVSSFILLLILLSALTGCDRQKRPADSVVSDSQKSNIKNSNFTEKERLGKLLFFEPKLSTPEGQACSDCHDPIVGFTDPDKELPVSNGAHPGMYGNRNDMPVSYSAFVPPLHKERDDDEDLWVGGLFWDGRANTLEEQAQGPPLNPLEMANPDTATIARKLENLSYAELFIEVYGPDAIATPGKAFSNMADAIAAYEKTSEVNPFSSKYDFWLQGKAELSDQEMRGLNLFEAENKGNCAACHPNKSGEDGTPPLFTDFTYDNLGTPRNLENPFYSLPPELNPDGSDYIDLGLGKIVNDPNENGKFRVPTLRNIAITSPYMHNGVFKKLFTVMAFYNSRDTRDWPPPEVSENINTDEMGDLGLTTMEMEDLVAFLHTLTDGWE